ncbi:hypothetical protein JOB18_048328 [Solea senegalensis]|uniref:Uncharacterized protein n=1 Tax=Solea senegalensis TaxID=28829 RepID=A0AAV6SXM9_SOLSE|nr:hypothetical protein JOB18_048328 [Solea senegalensis]
MFCSPEYDSRAAVWAAASSGRLSFLQLDHTTELQLRCGRLHRKKRPPGAHHHHLHDSHLVVLVAVFTSYTFEHVHFCLESE